MGMNNKNISILGCGWLGFPLAQKLIDTGYEVKGSTTSENKIEILKSHKIEPFLINLEENQIVGNVSEFLNNSEILIIDIPPGLRKVTTTTSEKIFVNKIKTLLPFVENSTIKKVIFVSSTSVYGDTDSIPTVTELSDLQPDTESGKQLMEVEHLLKANLCFQTVIIRFGGLIGEDRNPIYMLAGKSNIANPDAPINLIHQFDCIDIIVELVKNSKEGNLFNDTFNAVFPYHPTRKEYYTKLAIAKNLTLPTFTAQQKSLGKIISSVKLQQVLAYTFKTSI